MGFSQSYRCKTCGLAATVSGGDDFGFIAKTQTRYCAQCQKLIDVCVGLWEQTLPAGEQFGECHFCKTLTEQRWSAGDPCPRCGGEVEATGEEMLDWD